MNYRETVAYIQTLPQRGWRGNLQRMDEALRLSACMTGQDPRAGKTFVHVAGTNGKGTVTAYVESILTSSGRQTGGYFSPFVYTIRERIRLNGGLITRRDFARIGTMARRIDDDLRTSEFGPLSEFEFKTLMGFLFWNEKRCSHVALEVGIGGRLDSTNVLDASIAVIASIGLDHVGILGDTVEKIAAEKAGIIRPDCPVVVGRLAPGPLEVVSDIAQRRRAKMKVLGRDFDWKPTGQGIEVMVDGRHIGPLEPGIRGSYHEDNLSIAVAASLLAVPDLPNSDIATGARQASLPGRFEVRQYWGKTIVLDGAHNPASAEGLARELSHAFPGQRIALVGGMVGGHDPTAFFSTLASVVDEAHFAPIDFHRAVPPSDLLHDVGHFFKRASVHPSVPAAVTAALAADVVVVTGSFYLVGEVGTWLTNAPVAV